MDMVEIGGMWWPADENSAEYSKVHLANTKALERAIQLCPHKRVAIQAGGSYGVWPKILAKHFQYVYTFEPDWVSFNCLARNCQEPNIYKFQAALQDNNKTVVLKRKSDSGHRVVSIGHGFVPGMTIDMLDVPVDAILLDVEGFEIKALNGGYKSIGYHHPLILVEDRPEVAAVQGLRPGDLDAFIQTRLGYTFAAQAHCDKIYLPTVKK